MHDYRSDHSPDIALLLMTARFLRVLLEEKGLLCSVKEMDDALKPFEHYPNPVETEETERRNRRDDP